MPLGTEDGLGPGHIVLDGDPVPHPKKGHTSPISAHVYCGQTAGLIKMPLGVRRLASAQAILCYMGTSLPSKKGHSSPPHTFGSMSVVTKRLNGSRCYWVRRYASALATLC